MRHLKLSSICLVGGICVSVLLSSCLPDYFPRRHLTRKVEDRELIGTWRLTDKSADVLRRAGLMANQSKQQIVFKAPGSCLFQGYSEAAHAFVEAEGNYTLEYGASHLAGRSKVNVLEINLGVLPETGKIAYQRLYFAERNGHLIVWHYLGDADARMHIDYQRQQ